MLDFLKPYKPINSQRIFIKALAKQGFNKKKPVYQGRSCGGATKGAMSLQKYLFEHLCNFSTVISRIV